MSQMAGKQSIFFDRPAVILSHACVGGKKEGEGPLGDTLDLVVEDPLFGQENWEESESQFVRAACETALKKEKRKKEEVRMAFCGDLLGQLIASSFGIKQMNIPYYGVYGACSSIGVSLSMAAMAVSGGFADLALAASSSHFASAEKEFRFPLGYGNQRPYSATWTVTGAGAFLLGNVESGQRKERRQERQQQKTEQHTAEKKIQETEKTQEPFSDAGRVVIRGVTTGKIKDYGVQDPFNMGACMAPAAADTIYQSLEDFQMEASAFDAIVTGDLGAVGQKLLFSLLEENGVDLSANHMDCGMQIYDETQQDTHAGGSGCACSALVLSAKILPRLASGEWKKVLFVPTGALLSQVSSNEGRSIPAIAHAVYLEHV